jgi:hypothetical protein
MHPRVIAHCAFDNVTIIDTEVCAVNLLTVARTVATVMLLVIHEFIMDRSVAPLDVIIPHSNTIALEEVAHSESSLSVRINRSWATRRTSA